ncbi:MAG: lamin tail domain-containing protein, partial [Bacteroidota bacterium]|nr:lamin tail domain-containing protein [Bacteroidota bacterium]
MASNQTSFQDPASEGEYDDWIEIYNPGNEAVDLGGLFISDNKDFKTKHKIPTTDPAKTTIQPGGYLILWADSEMEQGELHVDFKLSADGEDLGIYTADGQVVDETTFGFQKTDVSAGRLPNG